MVAAHEHAHEVPRLGSDVQLAAKEIEVAQAISETDPAQTLYPVSS